MTEQEPQNGGILADRWEVTQSRGGQVELLSITALSGAWRNSHVFISVIQSRKQSSPKETGESAPLPAHDRKGMAWLLYKESKVVPASSWT